MDPTQFWMMIESIATFTATILALYLVIEDKIQNKINRPIINIEYDESLKSISNKRFRLRVINTGKSSARCRDQPVRLPWGLRSKHRWMTRSTPRSWITTCGNTRYTVTRNWRGMCSWWIHRLSKTAGLTAKAGKGTPISPTMRWAISCRTAATRFSPITRC